jgi:hypothetical protein
MFKQSEINEDMRAVLLDWFVDVMGECLCLTTVSASSSQVTAQ